MPRPTIQLCQWSQGSPGPASGRAGPPAPRQISIGEITSGGFGPTVGAPVAMGYLPADISAPGTTVYGEVRGKRLPATVTALPFVPANFKR